MGQPTWPTLKSVRQATNLEFIPALAKRHHFVKLTSGRWYRTLGPPNPVGLVQTGPRVWHRTDNVVRMI